MDQYGREIDQYHVIEKLGQGGMAVVYRAYDTRLERDVAIKILRMDIFGAAVHDRLLMRFDREIKALVRLEHPNIISVIDYGNWQGAPYLVMPLITGGTLKKFTGKAIRWQDAVNIIIPIADALSYAHKKGLIHRDVKPSNILITESGKPMLTDFGIAKLIEVEEGQTLTGTGVGIGTPEYMAPEQGLGKAVDGRTDIYAMGVVLFELITGSKPYIADTPLAVLLKQVNDPLPNLRSYHIHIPTNLERILYKSLAKQPENRYGNMNEFKQVLMRQLQEDAQKVFPTNNFKQPRQVVKEKDTESNWGTVDQFDNTTYLMEENPSELAKKMEMGAPKPKWQLWVGLGGILSIFGLLVLVVGSLFITQNKRLAAQVPIPTAIKTPEKMDTQAPTNTTTPAPTKTTTEMQTSTATNIPTRISTLALGIGSAKVREEDNMEMVYVPAGVFSMGSDNGKDNEKPVHTVHLDAYWIDKYEVTNAQYAQCVEAKYCDKPKASDSVSRIGPNEYYGSSNYKNYPVIFVNWIQAKTYCEWAGGQLPTEAQWEKAARGPDERIYTWGDDILSPQLANYGRNVGDTTAVGSYPDGASPYGALDMAGNVWEWVADWFNGSYYINSPDRNPTGPTTGNFFVLRGGSWLEDDEYIRSSFRYGYYDYFLWEYTGSKGSFNPYNAENNIGFRCVVMP